MDCECGHPSECHELDSCRFMLPDGSYPCDCENAVDHEAAGAFLRDLGL